MKFELKDYHRKISDAECVEDLRAVSEKVGKDTITINDYSIHGKYHRNTIRKKFGSWYAAMRIAGLKPPKGLRNGEEVTADELFKNLAIIWVKLGRQPKLREMVYPLSRHSYSVYVRLFGSWMDAVRKFIEYQNSVPYATDAVDGKIMAAQIESLPSAEERTKGNQLTEKCRREIPPRLRFAVFIRDGLRCTVCGKSTITYPGLELHCDHIDPWSNGGKTVMENLRTLCAECNIGKGNIVGA